MFFLTAAGSIIGEQTIRAAGMVLDPLRCQVRKGRETIHLTVKESRLLELLMLEAGQVVHKESILARIWGEHSACAPANVELYIHYLRKKLNSPSIKTVHGIGYSLQEDEDVPKTAP